MKTNIRILALGTLALATFAQLPAFAQVAPVLGVEPANDLAFKEAHPDCGILRHGDQIARVYGNFASGNSPTESALKFIDEQALGLYGVGRILERDRPLVVRVELRRRGVLELLAAPVQVQG